MAAVTELLKLPQMNIRGFQPLMAFSVSAASALTIDFVVSYFKRRILNLIFTAGLSLQ